MVERERERVGKRNPLGIHLCLGLSPACMCTCEICMYLNASVRGCLFVVSIHESMTVQIKRESEYVCVCV